jgi:hypothetical protein
VAELVWPAGREGGFCDGRVHQPDVV